MDEEGEERGFAVVEDLGSESVAEVFGADGGLVSALGEASAIEPEGDSGDPSRQRRVGAGGDELVGFDHGDGGADVGRFVCRGTESGDGDGETKDHDCAGDEGEAGIKRRMCCSFRCDGHLTLESRV